MPLDVWSLLDAQTTEQTDEGEGRVSLTERSHFRFTRAKTHPILNPFRWAKTHPIYRDAFFFVIWVLSKIHFGGEDSTDLKSVV